MERLVSFETNGGGVFQATNPQEDLMNLLVQKTKELGHEVSFSEAKEDPNFVQPNSYAYYFDSFGRAAKRALYLANLDNDEDETKEPEKTNQTQDTVTAKKGEKLIRSKLLDTNNTRPKIHYTSEEIKKRLTDFYKEKGHLPTQGDVLKYGLPSWATIIKFLGPREGWLDIVESQIEDQGTESEGEADEGEGQPADEEQKTEGKKQPTDQVEIEEVSEEESEDDSEEVSVATEVVKNVPDPSDSPDIEIKSFGQIKIGEDPIAIEIKITLPGREKPVLINLTL